MDIDPGELGLYLNLSVDDDRASFLLEQAVTLAQSIVTPLPDSAKPIVLAAAGRAYANPQGVTAETVGPYTVQRPTAGLYLTSKEERTLRRLAGRGGAFTIDPTPADADPWVTWPVDGTDRRDDPTGVWHDYEPGWT